MIRGKIGSVAGVQSQLDALAKDPTFQEIYDQEISSMKLRKVDVERCRKNLYHEVSKHAHGNDGTIRIRKKDFVPDELAAVVSYFKMQDDWEDALKWEVVD